MFDIYKKFNLGALLLLVALFSFQSVEAQTTPPGLGFRSQIVNQPWFYSDDSLASKQGACLAWRVFLGGSNGWYSQLYSHCVVQFSGGSSTNANVYTASLTAICADGNGGFVAADVNSMCPDPETTECPTVLQGGLNPFLPNCECPVGEMVINDLPNAKVGCMSTTPCPSAGTPIAAGCSIGAYTERLCIGQGDGSYCEAFRTNGMLSHTGTGGGRTYFCSDHIIEQVSVLGCDEIYSEATPQFPPATTTAPIGSQLPPEEYGTTDTDIENGARNKETTISGQATTLEDGTKVQETNIANTYTDNSSGAETNTQLNTTTTTLPSGRQHQVVRYTDEAGVVTEKTVGIDGNNECSGPLCGVMADEGTGTTAGTCDLPPVCTGTPLECAPLQQEWNLQCAITLENEYDCEAAIACQGNPLLCAGLKMEKMAFCTMYDDEGMDADESLSKFKVGVDDGESFNGDDNNIELDGLLDNLDLDGLGWGSSCPAPTGLAVIGQQINLSWIPFCTFLGSINPIVLLMALIHAGIILIRGLTGSKN